jgi:hypothetical protein
MLAGRTWLPPPITFTVGANLLIWTVEQWTNAPKVKCRIDCMTAAIQEQSGRTFLVLMQ